MVLLDLVYVALLVVLAPWLIYQAVANGKYREGYHQKLLGWLPRRSGDRYCVWLHAVSVGEVNLLAPLIRELRGQHPDWELVITTTTMTGHELAVRKYPELTVDYCPLDFSWATATAMRRIRPDLLVLAELELWPNLIRAAERQGAQVAVINGRLSERSFRGYRKIAWLLRSTLARLNLVIAQTPEYAARFAELGVRAEAIQIVQSIKYDGVEFDRNHPATVELRELAGIAADDIVLLAGSTQAPEELLALQTYATAAKQHPRLRLVIVPRHPHRFEEVARLLDTAGIPWQRRSELDQNSRNSAARVLLVDAVGELGSWWGTATVGFVGGSLSRRGGQNMIEPAAYGVAVCFGPHTQNFRDVVHTMTSAEAAVVVPSGEALTEFVMRCLDDPEFAHQLGSQARELVASGQGATQQTVELLAALSGVFPGSASHRRAA